MKLGVYLGCGGLILGGKSVKSEKYGILIASGIVNFQNIFMKFDMNVHLFRLDEFMQKNLPLLIF